MHCLILFRDSAGRLPTAQELRRCGFEVSTAALPQAESPHLDAPAPVRRPQPQLALAAETAAQYGSSQNRAAHPEPPVSELAHLARAEAPPTQAQADGSA